MPLPTAAELTDPNATNAQMKDRLGQLVKNIDRSYSSLTEANADIANIEVGVTVTVNAENGGKYYKATADATSLTKSNYDSLTKAKEYVDSNFDKVVFSAKNKFDIDLIQTKVE
ncbi:spore coat protein CotH, partial [Acinetobacter sp. GC2]|nr:spore coat protein CotH [Acinetobacter lwoffii]